MFCTQPFRLPYAGRVGICIFDKTGVGAQDVVFSGDLFFIGTLTSDELQLQVLQIVITYHSKPVTQKS